ncbi:MAG: hypothetical protein QW568_02865 [Candidatus Anstonellaceae archaeon]
MNGFAIVKLEVDAAAAKESIVQQFNEYMQQKQHTQAFIHENEGYFRMEYNDKIGASSAAISELGAFLQSSGYTVSGITSSTKGENSTVVSFSDSNGKEASVVLSTVNIY